MKMRLLIFPKFTNILKIFERIYILFRKFLFSKLKLDIPCLSLKQFKIQNHFPFQEKILIFNLVIEFPFEIGNGT